MGIAPALDKALLLALQLSRQKDLCQPFTFILYGKEISPIHVGGVGTSLDELQPLQGPFSYA